MTVLSDSSVADYKTENYLSSSSAPFLRSLHTAAFSDQPVCQSLEQPNIVTGLPAAGTLPASLTSRVSYPLPVLCLTYSGAKKVLFQTPIVQVLPLKIMRDA